MLSTKIYILHGLPFSSQYTTGKASTIQKSVKCHNNDIELKGRLNSITVIVSHCDTIQG